MRKILLLGMNGQVGWELHRTLLPLGEVIALDAPVLDFTNLSKLREQVKNAQPDVIVNAVAYTAVDQAESQPDLAMQINAYAPGCLAELASELKSVLVHYSSDYVFDGTKNSPYVELDSTNPLGVYGKSKLAGDEAILNTNGAAIILRPSWVYSNRRDNFVKKVIEWAHTRSALSVVNDQVSCPTWARALAEVTAQVLAKGTSDLWNWTMERRGVYHLAGSGFTSRFEWAEEILRLDSDKAGQSITSLNPALTDDFPTPARRPLFTPLDCTHFSETFGLELPDWRISLRLAMDAF